MGNDRSLDHLMPVLWIYWCHLLLLHGCSLVPVMTVNHRQTQFSCCSLIGGVTTCEATFCTVLLTYRPVETVHVVLYGRLVKIVVIQVPDVCSPASAERRFLSAYSTLSMDLNDSLCSSAQHRSNIDKWPHMWAHMTLTQKRKKGASWMQWCTNKSFFFFIVSDHAFMSCTIKSLYFAFLSSDWREGSEDEADSDWHSRFWRPDQQWELVGST